MENRMNKIVFIIPYYGKFPNYFKLFLKSCEYNSSYDWKIFTDIVDDISLPQNVECIHMSFVELKSLIQSKFDFPISLESPYKLCDYKPAYGYVFAEYLLSYEYWGYCDIDLLFGNLEKLLPFVEIKKYDKVGYLGHLSLYRNEKENNSIFKNTIKGTDRYKTVFSTNNICVFDEWGKDNINELFLEAGKKIWYWDNYLDIYPYDDCLKPVKTIVNNDKRSISNYIERKPIVALWDEGNLFKIVKDVDLYKYEFAYVHLQKRKMSMNVNYSNNLFLCVADGFVSFSNKRLQKELCLAKIHNLINKKRLLYLYGTIKYFIIEKSGPIRHKIRKIKSQNEQY